MSTIFVCVLFLFLISDEHSLFLFKAVIHGDLRLSNIVRFDSSLMLIDLDSSYSLPVGAQAVSDINYFGGNSHKFSSGIISPEMLAKIELPSQQIL